MTTKRHARRRLLAIGLAVAAVSGLLLGLALGGDEPDTSPGTPTTTSTLDDDPFEAAVAQGVIAASNGLVDADQARCVARRLTNTLGRRELVQVGRAAREGDPLPIDVQDAVLEAMVGCVPDDVLEEIGRRQERG